MRRLRFVIVVLLAAIGAGMLTSCDLVAGDSLVVQAARGTDNPFFAAEDTKDGVTIKGVAGIAPCDYERAMVADYEKHKPTRVSLAFSGNNGTACTGHVTGALLAENYRVSLERISRYFASKKVPVIFSAPVCVGPGVTWSNGDPLLRSMERDLAATLKAQRLRVAYSEYAATRICPGWNYNPSLRSTDGIHFNRAGALVFALALRTENKTTVV